MGPNQKKFPEPSFQSAAGHPTDAVEFYAKAFSPSNPNPHSEHVSSRRTPTSFHLAPVAGLFFDQSFFKLNAAVHRRAAHGETGCCPFSAADPRFGPPACFFINWPYWPVMATAIGCRIDCACVRRLGCIRPYPLSRRCLYTWQPVHPPLIPPTSSIPWLLGYLTLAIGLPFFVLSANGPLLQRWFSRATHGVDPYLLFAASNIGKFSSTHPLSFPDRAAHRVVASNRTVGVSGLFYFYPR